ncbi:MAG: hypothetical protein CMH52_07675 [Myxococcales bacterium]|nr:hypothetical protein [Myxococcales bacterium]
MKIWIVTCLTGLIHMGCGHGLSNSNQDNLGEGRMNPPSRSQIQQTLSYKDTIGFAGIDSPHLILQDLIRILDDIKQTFEESSPSAVLDALTKISSPKKRAEFIGFDPATEDGWKSIGIDPGLGLYVVGDKTLFQPKNPMMFGFGLESREKFLKYLHSKGKQIQFIEGANGVDTVVANQRVMGLLGQRGPYTYLFPISRNTKNLDQLKVAFSDFIKSTSTNSDALVIPGQARAAQFIGLINFDPLFDVIKGMEQGPPADIEFYKKKLKSFGARNGSGVFAAHLRAKKPGQDTLRKLFGVPTKMTTAKFYGQDKWALARLSINWPEFFQGLAELMPPSMAQQRMVVTMAQTAIATNMGFSQEIFKEALSGHMMFGLDLSSIKSAQPEILFAETRAVIALGTHNAKAAKVLFDTVMSKLGTHPDPRFIPKAQRFGEYDGYHWPAAPGNPALVLAEDAVLIGPNAASVKQALEHAKSNNFASTKSGVSIQAKGIIIGSHVPYNDVLEMIVRMARSTNDLNQTEQESITALSNLLDQSKASKPMEMALKLEDGVKLNYEGELIGTQFVSGIISAIVIPAFTTLKKKSMSTEAKVNLQRLAMAQRAYYEADRADRNGKILPKQFAGPSKLVPGNPTEFMCKDGRPIEFKPTPETFSAPVWQALGFAIEDPFRYAYQVEIEGKGTLSRFTVRAVGDLDCDGQLSTFEQSGRIQKGGAVSVGRSSKDELE